MDKKQMYRALVEKDKAFDGSFYAGVKTTGIFCRTICTARKPKQENVQFYDTVASALAAGFRPCKICRPLEGVGAMPSDIKALIDEVEAAPYKKIKEYELRQRGYDPATLRRWFIKNYGLSFSAFCRMNRINHGFERLKSGDGVLDAALASGFDSASGFTEAFEKVFGLPPGKKNQKAPLIYKRFDTPLGPMIVVANTDGIVLLEFGERTMLETELKGLVKHFKAAIVPGTNKHIKTLILELDGYMKGLVKHFSVPMVWQGTDFQKKAWQALMAIPYGETRSYGQQADSAGNGQAVRAIGTANGMNKLAILIPCHRVIGSNGQLSGYGGGVWRKAWLIEHEKKHSDSTR